MSEWMVFERRRLWARHVAGRVSRRKVLQGALGVGAGLVLARPGIFCA
jgi:UPF0716 family protein affecting phage T7 exclusion